MIGNGILRGKFKGAESSNGIFAGNTRKFAIV